MKPSNAVLERPSAELFDANHPFSTADLRLYAYSEKLGGEVSLELARHLAECERCEEWLKILRVTDPVLTGEDEKSVKILIREVQAAPRTPKLSKPLLAFGAAVGTSVGTAVTVFRTLFGPFPERQLAEERMATAARVAEQKSRQALG